MHGSVSISRFQDKLCKWRWQWHSVFIICRHQSCWREAIFVEQDIHGTVFGVGKLASIALAMTWHENWIIVRRQHIWLKNDFWWRRKHEQKWGDCRPLEWRRASTPLKCSSLNITVKEGRWRWGGWQFLNNIKIMKSVVLVCTPNVRVEDLWLLHLKASLRDWCCRRQSL